ncbi:hypothetical protein Prudu_1101S000200, partial [Prunus dulcis]
FTQSKADYSLYTYKREKSFIALLIYVDDIPIIGNNLAAINSPKHFLRTRFRIKDLQDLKFFLGIEVSHSKKGISLSERKYTLDILKDGGHLGVRPISFPMNRISNYQIHVNYLRTQLNTKGWWVPHMEVALHILKYLKNTPKTSLKQQAYCDSDWAGCPITRRSTTGYCVFLGSSLISWRTKRQNIVLLVSAEAEYRAMTGACCELT